MTGISWSSYWSAAEAYIDDLSVTEYVPLAFAGTNRGQVAYGQEVLPQDGRELVAQDWVNSSDGKRMLAVLRNGSYGLDCTKQELHFSLIRGAAYSAHPIPNRPLIRSDRYIPRIDQGEHTFSFRLIGGKHVNMEQELERYAQLFNEKPFCLQMFPTCDMGEKAKSLLKLEGDQVIMTAFKASVDGGYVLRLFNNLPRAASCECTIQHLNLSESLQFRPFEVRTFRLTQKGLESCTEMII